MARNPELESSPSINIISSGTIIKGDVKSDGDIRIDGTLIGTIKCKGKLVIGATGKAEGEIHCQNADISGEIKAKITVGELLALKSSSKLIGDIITNQLSIEPGANFSGTCSMGAVVKEMKQDEEETPAEEFVGEENTRQEASA